MKRRSIFALAAAGGKTVKVKRASRPRPAPRDVTDLLNLPMVTGQRVILPYPPAALSPNWRGHWAAKARAVKLYRRECWALALAAGLRLPTGLSDDAPIVVRLDFFPPDRAARDDDNAIAAFKAGRDGVADALKTDDARFRSQTHFHTEPRSCVAVTLIDPQNEGDYHDR